MTPTPRLSRSPLSRRHLLRAAGGAAALAAAGPLLTACGSSESVALDPTAKPDLDGVTLKILANQPNALSFKYLSKPFEEATGAKLSVTPVPYDKLTAKAVLDVQSGAGQFDVFMYWYAAVGTLAEGGVIEDLTAYIKAHKDIEESDFLPSLYDTYTRYDGKRWGLPYDGDTHILFYNTEIFERHKVEAPRTWDEYNDIAAKITKDARGKYYGTIIEAQQVPVILGCAFANRLAGYGGSFLDASGAPTLDTPEAIEAAQVLFDAAPSALPTPLQIGFDQALPAFLDGKGAMLDFWTDFAKRAQDPKQSKVVDKWAVTTLPVGGDNTRPRTSLDAGFGLAVSTASKQKEAAAAFIKWATAAQQNLLVLARPDAGADPIRTSTLSSSAFRKNSPDSYEVVRTGLAGDPLPWPTVPKAPDLLQTLVDELALGLQGKQSAKTALGNTQRAWAKELKGASG
ncbi:MULTISPECIES: sugar ABC transporter substrate-binding protein [Streptomyces]|uniref:Sugar ABC transporter substrate-binding protein n=1 Tax=Streptomyces koelreuteriae TaxID=2838015 RepID=A0ABX8FJH4_9ACTN|nr:MULTISPECIES: sugar ABC transporter substrate-binding protein [Streptomyces]QWB21273.1 sugar ABC transporter substrate-binding protein [Streptomyces koelreuteriae]UUA04190.1 sugar ABC transporter substrate-binding protein [Streptomyces koelreuteriae]UUA11816.1 sugar ABC transporter substrate-binding protein [Streptomyces sp. CRCS-T-1]